MSQSVSKRSHLPARKRNRGEHPVLRAQALQTYLNYRMGMTLTQAWRASHPARKVTDGSAKAQAGREIRYVEQYCAQDLEAMLAAHNLSPKRLCEELDARLKAMTLDEVVETKVVKVKSPAGGEKAETVTTRNTIEVIDNNTRMRATELLKHIIMPNADSPVPQVFVLRIDGRIHQPKDAGRSEDLVGVYEPAE